ncbi:hypothetical protein [Leucobacter celer]|jgi:hypothetical protein|uniref:hypothetical protein n=1 Tax=Leucobacter celer TaxID=668625 RepID=UPI0006A76FBF|nr:hypothetical protein [Leucobacter celer]
MSRGGRAETRAIRAVLRRRSDRIGLSEVSYRIYLAVMLVIIVGAPAVRGIVLWLSGALPAGGETSPGALAAALTALTALLVLAGAHGGPAHAALPQLDLLHTTPIPRARLLAAPVRRGFAAGAASGALLAGLVAAARGLRGELDPGLGAALLLAGAGIGAIAAGAVLVGQAGRRVRAAVAAALALLALTQWRFGIPPDPWSAAARLLASSTDGATQTGLGAATVFGLAVMPVLGAALAVVLAPLLVNRMRWESLREQAAGADVVQVLALSGDPGAALARLGAPVRTGRRWLLRPIRNLTAAIVQRDLLGIARTPARSLVALAGVGAAGALWGIVIGAGPASAGPVPAGLLGAGSLLLAHLAAVPWFRGLAAAAAGSGSAPLLPGSPAGIAARHLIVPGALATAAYLGGAIWSGAVRGSDVDPSALPGWVIPASGVLVVATALLLRALAAFKGPLPMKLLAPVPTPAGDLAGINVLLWSLDGPISAVLAGALLGVLWAPVAATGGWPIAASIVSLLLLAVLSAWALVRMAPAAQGR